MDFYEVVAKRCSVRHFKSEPVPKKTMQRILNAVRQAPSWANTQAWEFILVTDADIKKELQQTLSPHNPAASAITAAPILICAIGLTGRSGFYRGQPSTQRGDWVLFDLGIACEHLALAAAAENLGTVHVGAFDYLKAGEILQLPANRTLIELIPLGYPEHTTAHVPRKPLDEFIFENKFGKNWTPIDIPQT